MNGNKVTVDGSKEKWLMNTFFVYQLFECKNDKDKVLSSLGLWLLL